MTKHLLVPVLMAVTMAANIAASQPPGFLSGQRVLVDAHNCFPYEGLWADRLDRALSAGVPIAIENDLTWAATASGPRIVVSHGGTAEGNEPTLANWFFEKVRPVVEKALKEGRPDQWPLLTLNLNDLRDNDPKFFTALWKLIGHYESWLCTARKTSELRQVAPLDVKPVLVLTSDGKWQRQTFYDDVPVGGRLRMFAAGNPQRKADNFCRWINYDWKTVEPEGQPQAGSWSPADAARLKALVDNAHQRGYWIRFYTLNGHRPLETVLGGWAPGYNFGTLQAVTQRWNAAKSAGVDFIATDQYEQCAKVLRSD